MYACGKQNKHENVNILSWVMGFMDTHVVLSSPFWFIIENLLYKKLYKNNYIFRVSVIITVACRKILSF